MDKESFMREALKLAADGAAAGEVPVGAVVVKDGEIIGRGRNRTEELKNPFAHAEMNAMKEALEASGGWRLTDCEMYVTLEPCAMCAGAVVHARIKKIYIGTQDPKTGACGSVMNILADKHLNHQPETETGILQEECSQLLKNFFRQLRRNK
jgi:tRNA(adenine34) deaminase